MKGKGKKKVEINKEETAENWCFVCKDGGDLRICDYKQCIKSYHPGCVRKDDSFLESEKKWDCSWHACFRCRRSPCLHCYTCTNAVCRHCLPAAEILQVKGKYGFCKPCLKLAILIEEKRDYDSDGEKVDFTDRETCEGLFMEYYMIIKKDEGLKLGDIYAAKDRVKAKKNHQPESGSEEFDEKEEEDEEQISDYDGSEDEKKSTKTRKRSKGQKSAKQKTPVESNKKEFIGWASRSLIEFLNSIGKSTSEKLSQHDVTSIVNEYVKENKLMHPERKRMIMCDARLQRLFRRKTLNRYRVRDILEDHFAENHDESEEDELAYDSEDNNEVTPNACKRQRKLDVEKKPPKKYVENNMPQSRFASIVVENVKLVYLRRSVLKETLKQPESFEEKVTGCFVRVKSDPYDHLSRKSHQLLQVKGVKTVPIDENNTETVLLFSDMPKEIRMSLLSDEDFSKEECEDLRKKVLASEIERPTVEDLQRKANAIHNDITNHWIRKELALLQNLIDRANEKGWRRELFEYLERRKRLQSPLEQSRLLGNVPTVIPDDYEPDCNSGGIENDIKSDEGSPKSTLPSNSSVPSDERQDHKESEEHSHDGHTTSPCEKGQLVSGKSASKEVQRDHTPNDDSQHDSFKKNSKEAEAKRNSWSEKMVGDKPAKAKGREVIDIVSEDEDDDESKKGSELENEEVWCVKGPNGERNKSSMSVLKRWSDNSPYAHKFKVWKEDESEEDAILLPEAIIRFA